MRNALDATKSIDTPEIRVLLSAGEDAVLTVRDNGGGIEDLENLFEPFYTTKEVGTSEGMGLGLSISYGIVQSFGGDIRGENAPGGGALFSVFLERWHDEAAA